MPKLSLTAEAIRALELPAAGEGGTTRQAIYYDTRQPGLGVRVTSGGARVYIAEGSIAGDTVRVKLGRVEDLTLSQARARAQQVRGRIAGGVNPNTERKAKQAQAVTLAEAFEAFIGTRTAAGKLAPRTEYDYRRLLYGAMNAAGERRHNGYLSAWRARPIFSITRAMVENKHAELLERSPAQAKYAMRMLSSVYNFARAKHGAAGTELPENPVRILSELKAWARIERRKTVLKAHQLEAWFRAVLELASPATNGLDDVVRDYLVSLVLTGHRPGEWARLEIRDVDLKARTTTVRGTKNKSDHTLPMSDYLHELFARRLASLKGRYVFPGAGPRGYLVEPKKMIAKVREASGLAFIPNDLRRTFISIAESIDIPAYALKRLLNHKMTNDVTAGYIVTDVERLRAPMQKVTDFILRAARLRESAEVLDMKRAAGAAS